MSIVPATRLGANDVIALLGAGGMGEIYRARDSRLDRDVAIKILTTALADDHAFRDRFHEFMINMNFTSPPPVSW
jgi:serine/threonine protein kinase